jgi:hypothetical protein
MLLDDRSVSIATAREGLQQLLEQIFRQPHDVVSWHAASANPADGRAFLSGGRHTRLDG